MTEKKLKVGLFIDSFFPMVDGVIMVVDNYARRLCEFCDVTVFTLKPKGKCTKTFPYKVVQCKSAKIPYGDYDMPLPKLDRKFKKALKESNLDIVHIHSPFAIGKMGVKYAKKHNIPAIATMHSQFEKDFLRATKSKIISKLMLKHVMKVFNQCDKCYAVNGKIAEIFYDYGAKIMPLVQRNGTDMMPVADEKSAWDMVNQKFSILPQTPVFLFVGRINRLKNIFFIVDALEKLKQKDFKMLFVGEGQDFEEFSKYVENSSIKNNIILTGRITDRKLLEAIYSRAKLFLFPSMYDASSLVQIEAASQKTPTVFLKGSATSATVTENVNGFLAEDSPEKFAEKIDQILCDEKLYKLVQSGAVKDLFVTWDDCVKEIFQKYLQAIDEK